MSETPQCSPKPDETPKSACNQPTFELVVLDDDDATPAPAISPANSSMSSSTTANTVVTSSSSSMSKSKKRASSGTNQPGNGADPEMTNLFEQIAEKLDEQHRRRKMKQENREKTGKTYKKRKEKTGDVEVQVQKKEKKEKKEKKKVRENEEPQLAQQNENVPNGHAKVPNSKSIFCKLVVFWWKCLLNRLLWGNQFKFLFYSIIN